MMKKYEIVADFPGSPDGMRVVQFTRGQIVEIDADFSESLRNVSIREGWAKEIEPPKPTRKPAKKKAARRK